MTMRKSPPRTKQEAEDQYGEGEVQQCQGCGGWYSKHSHPGGCFACTMGLGLYHGPKGPSKLPLEGAN